MSEVRPPVLFDGESFEPHVPFVEDVMYVLERRDLPHHMHRAGPESAYAKNARVIARIVAEEAGDHHLQMYSETVLSLHIARKIVESFRGFEAVRHDSAFAHALVQAA